jgi:hypothetical protein
VLNAIIAGTDYGEIVFQVPLNPSNNAATEPYTEQRYFGLEGTGTLVEFQRARIIINPLDTASWNRGNDTHNAFTLLHELGHMFNDIPGLGGFALGNQAEQVDPFAFDRVINENCFGGQVTYPY